MLQSPLDSQAATLFQVLTSAAWAVPAPTVASGIAMPAPPAVTVSSEARLILLG
jgi:hypothetical protein